MSKEEKVSKKKKKKKGSLSTVILILILLVGLSVLLYPSVSDFWNSLHETRAIMDYDNVVSQMTDKDYADVWAAAEQYNDDLRSLSYPFSQYDTLNDEYYSVLDVAGNGIIGYVSIPCIGVELPIYHGTSDEVLNKAVGHLEGSSLPIGGESRHAVLSAHRGLPSAKLFTDLDQVSIGDEFYITVLNKTLTYEVDQITIVEPTQMEALNVTEGEDYVTLMTCTPYGINTHRLLVRGHRVETENGDVHVHADAFIVPIYVVIPMVAIPVLIIVLILMLFATRRRSSYTKYGEEISLEGFRRDQEREQQKKNKKLEKKKKKQKTDKKSD